MKKRIFYNVICPFLSVAVILAIWAVVSAVYDKPLLLPSVKSVFIDFFIHFGMGEFYAAIGMTFLRSIACFALALAFALPLSVCSAKWRAVQNVIKPVVEFLRSVPVIALILLALVAFNSSVLPIFVGFLMVFPLLYSALLNELTSKSFCDNVIMCKLYEVSNSDAVRYLYVPAIAPKTLEQGEILLPLAVKVVISGEVLAYAKTGLGLLMRSAQLDVATSRLVAYAFAAALLSYLAQLFIKLIRLCLRRAKLCR